MIFSYKCGHQKEQIYQMRVSDKDVSDNCYNETRYTYSESFTPRRNKDWWSLEERIMGQDDLKQVLPTEFC